LNGQIAPSILSFNLADLNSAVKTFLTAGCEIIHLDIMDGQFVPPITFGDAYVRSLSVAHPTAYLEAHLMTLTPERHFDSFAAAGCKRVIFHVEASSHAHRHAQALRALGISPGIAINPGTSVESVKELAEIVDLFLVMTVNPGWGGQAFIPHTVRKIRQIREISATVDIEVDGGIDPQTLPLVKDAGANVFVVGSFLAKAPNLFEATRELVEMAR
jgi:ribulose-phosphate 3-epimerase